MDATVITPAELTANMLSPFPAAIITFVGVASVITRLMTVSPTDADSAKFADWPPRTIMSTESMTVMVYAIVAPVLVPSLIVTVTE